MAPWVRKTFVDVLPKYLFIQRPDKEDEDEDEDEVCQEEKKGALICSNNKASPFPNTYADFNNEYGYRMSPITANQELPGDRALAR